MSGTTRRAPPSEAAQEDPEPVEKRARDADGAGAHLANQDGGAGGHQPKHEARHEESRVYIRHVRAVEIGERPPEDAPRVEGTQPGHHHDRSHGDQPAVQGASSPQTGPTRTPARRKVSERDIIGPYHGIHRSAWKGYSANFAGTEFCERPMDGPPYRSAGGRVR